MGWSGNRIHDGFRIGSEVLEDASDVNRIE